MWCSLACHLVSGQCRVTWRVLLPMHTQTVQPIRNMSLPVDVHIASVYMCINHMTHGLSMAVRMIDLQNTVVNKVDKNKKKHQRGDHEANQYPSRSRSMIRPVGIATSVNLRCLYTSRTASVTSWRPFALIIIIIIIIIIIVIIIIMR